MNKAFFLKKEDVKPVWKHINAEGKVLGRLATEIANVLRGKDRAYFTAHTDSGDYVVVTNAEKVVLTGSKWADKEYVRHSGYPGGLKKTTAKELLAKKPTEIVIRAVKGMLPKNKLNHKIIKKLKVYAGSEHPHKAQLG
ncbi:50S ribosomal protein L13 [Candidatus Dependentiae bacterium]|nr:50S ribosomal protein L13 [Candidatus Dependentiae bacterium]